MIHFLYILIYNIVFIVITLAFLFLLTTLLLIIKRLTFEKWAFKMRDKPLRYSQVKIRRFVGIFELYFEIVPYFFVHSVILGVLQYTYLPYVALFFYTIIFTLITSFGRFGVLFTSSIISSIDKCCLFLRPFELEALSISDGESKNAKVYKDISWNICGYLSEHVSQVYSIGNPRGMVDLIFNSVSIYARDEDWKNAIAILSKRAQVIVIHVGESNGCIWEIEHCSEQLLFDKVIFIVDEPNKLDFLKRFNILSEFEVFSGNCMLVYRDIKKGQWCYKPVNGTKNTEDEIKMIMLDYFSSREIILKQPLFESSTEKITMFEQKEINPEMPTLKLEKPWIHRLSFLLCPLGYCFANKWSESTFERFSLSFTFPYIFLLIVGLFGLGKICSIIAYALLIIVLAYWCIMCPKITAKDNLDSSDTMSTILNTEFLKRTIYSFVIFFLLLVSVSKLHTFGLNIFGI